MPVAAPLVLAGVLHHSGANRVEFDVAHTGQQVGFGLDRQLRLLCPLRRQCAYQQRQEKGRREHQERQQVPGLGLRRGGQLRVALLPRGKAQFYERKKAKTNNVVAIKALAHKLARACFHILKEKKPFDVTRCFA